MYVSSTPTSSASPLKVGFSGGTRSLTLLVSVVLLTVAWLLLEGAVVAEQAKAKTDAAHPDHAFYTGKTASALYYARNVLPGVEHKAQLLAEEDKSPLDIPDTAFATV